MLCLRLKLIQITNIPIRIKLRNGNPIKTIHIAIIVSLKIPFHNSCIPGNNHTLYIPLQNSTFPIPIFKPSDCLFNAFIHRPITPTINNIVTENLFYNSNIFIQPTLKIFSDNIFYSPCILSIISPIEIHSAYLLFHTTCYNAYASPVLF